MPIKLYNSEPFPYSKTPLNNAFPNLESFLKSLEQYYFAKVDMVTYKVKEDQVDLALELNCPLTLLEVLGHFNKKQWGYCGDTMNPLQKTLDELFATTHLSVDIAELTLGLQGTQIVIKKVGFQSIPSQFNLIMTTIARHYVHISKGLEELPYELFLPVYEDVFGGDGPSEQPNHARTSDYFTYWGVYMESDPEAQIYDVSRQLFIPASLDLCILDED
jgi:hypothetical protein